MYSGVESRHWNDEEEAPFHGGFQEAGGAAGAGILCRMLREDKRELKGTIRTAAMSVPGCDVQRRIAAFVPRIGIRAGGDEGLSHGRIFAVPG